MIKRTVLLIALTAVVTAVLPGRADARRGMTGYITSVSATSFSLRHGEITTFIVDSRTTYTKWITQKPWGQDTALNASALSVGSLVAVHPRDVPGSVADWVQIATDWR